MYSACLGFRYSNMVGFVLRRLHCVWLPLSVHICVLREKRLFLPSQSKQSDSLNSLLEELSDTHHGHLHTGTHTFQEGKVCYENMLMIWLWPSPSPQCLHNPMGLIWYHNSACFCLLPHRKLKGKPSLCTLPHLFFSFPHHLKFLTFFLEVLCSQGSSRLFLSF